MQENRNGDLLELTASSRLEGKRIIRDRHHVTCRLPAVHVNPDALSRARCARDEGLGRREERRVCVPLG
jgi:hypothetical protein